MSKCQLHPFHFVGCALSFLSFCLICVTSVPWRNANRFIIILIHFFLIDHQASYFLFYCSPLVIFFFFGCIRAPFLHCPPHLIISTYFLLLLTQPPSGLIRPFFADPIFILFHSAPSFPLFCYPFSLDTTEAEKLIL